MKIRSFVRDTDGTESVIYEGSKLKKKEQYYVNTYAWNHRKW